MAEPLKVKDLTLFQKWVVLRFHQSQRSEIPDEDLITGCCITAMNDDFNKETAKKELQQLEESEYIKAAGQKEGFESGFGQHYISTIDGVLFAKKIMKPILTAMNRSDFESAIKNLDSSEATYTMQKIFSDSKAQSQISILSRIADFGLQNMGAFSKLLDLVVQHVLE